jgi:hypothetical protein
VRTVHAVVRHDIMSRSVVHERRVERDSFMR